MASEAERWPLPAGKRKATSSVTAVPPKGPATAPGRVCSPRGLPGTGSSPVRLAGHRVQGNPCQEPQRGGQGSGGAVTGARGSTGQESSKSTPDGAFLLEGNGGSVTAQSPAPCSRAAAERSPPGFHTAQRWAGSSTHLLKPGLMRDSPGIFLLAGKVELAPLFFLGLGSAPVRDTQDGDGSRSATRFGSPASPSVPRSLEHPARLAQPPRRVRKGQAGARLPAEQGATAPARQSSEDWRLLGG